MDEMCSTQSEPSQCSADASTASAHFSVDGVYPGGTFSFHTQHPKAEIFSNQNLVEEEYKRECEKLARQTYIECHRDFSQRHFEQSCAVDKQLLWLSGAAIGLPVAYLGQIGLSQISYITFTILTLAWVVLLGAVFLILKSMDCGNDAFEFNIACLKDRYACESEGGTFSMPQNKAILNAQKLSAYAKKLLIVGTVLLVLFFTFDIFPRIKSDKILAQDKDEVNTSTDVPGDKNG